MWGGYTRYWYGYELTKSIKKNKDKLSISRATDNKKERTIGRLREWEAIRPKLFTRYSFICKYET